MGLWPVCQDSSHLPPPTSPSCVSHRHHPRRTDREQGQEQEQGEAASRRTAWPCRDDLERQSGECLPPCGESTGGRAAQPRAARMCKSSRQRAYFRRTTSTPLPNRNRPGNQPKPQFQQLSSSPPLPCCLPAIPAASRQRPIGEEFQHPSPYRTVPRRGPRFISRCPNHQPNGQTLSSTA